MQPIRFKGAGAVLFLLFGLSATSHANTVTAWGAYTDGSIPETYRPMHVPAGLSNVTAVSGGFNHAVALKQDGIVVPWGWPGASNVPVGLSNVVSVVAGNNVTVALKNNGTVTGWDATTNLALPAALSNVVRIAVGWNGLALRSDGTVVAWGVNPFVPPGLDRVIDVGIGRDLGFRGLALKDDRTVVAWGDSASWTNVPAAATNVIAIACGVSHVLALKVDGTVVAWGESSATNVPAGLSNVVSIAAGSFHNLAAKADGTVVAWGAGKSYVSDYFSAEKGQSIVPAGLSNVVAVAAGRMFSLALQGGGAPFLTVPLLNRRVVEGSRTELRILATGKGVLNYQWQFFGTNITGATNNSLIIPETLFSHAGPYSIIVSNSFGSVRASNVLEVVPVLITSHPTNQFRYMWGNATFNVRAYGREALRYQWRLNGVHIPGQTNSALLLTNLQLSQVGKYSVLVSNHLGSATSAEADLSLSQVVVWGESQTQTVPADWTNIMAIASSPSGNLVLRTDGTVSANGQLLTQGLPPGLNDIIAIAAGGDYSYLGVGMALRSNGTVVVWGDPRYDQHKVPFGLSHVVAMASDEHHCLALKADGSVVAWGFGGNGETNVPSGLSNAVAIAAGYAYSLILKSDGSLISLGNSPPPPPDLTNIVAIAAGYDHCLALRSDGTVAGWGGNFYGQSTAPGGLSNVVAIAAGQWHSLALKRDGRVVAWGGNFSSQTNAPLDLPDVIAISAGRVHNLVLLGGTPPSTSALITNFVRDPDGFKVVIPSESGKVYALEYCDSLSASPWIALPLVSGTGKQLILTDPTANDASRFYRVRRW